jgi:ferric-dicitrate binding protein FerR (iron transport regulator)
MKFGKKFEVRSSGGGGAVRGTRFISRLNQTGGMDLLVVEGCVEMKGTKEDKTVMVNAGYRCTASKDGILSEPRKVDLSNPEKWWEK